LSRVSVLYTPVKKVDWKLSNRLTDIKQFCSRLKQLWSTILIDCFDQLLWSTALIDCFDWLLWSTALIDCFDQMIWSNDLIEWVDRMIWSTALIDCFGRLLWSNDLIKWFDTLLPKTELWNLLELSLLKKDETCLPTFLYKVQLNQGQYSETSRWNLGVVTVNNLFVTVNYHFKIAVKMPNQFLNKLKFVDLMKVGLEQRK
jgi:hypothetical protein